MSYLFSRILLVAVVSTLAFVGCTKGPQKEPNIELIQDMMDQPALKAQDYMISDPKKASSRQLPVGTVPRDHKPYPYHLDLAAAEKGLKNPLAGDFNEKILAVGQKKYDVYCAVCHGALGKGEGPVAAKMPIKPPALATDAMMIGYSDARIYHAIVDGKGVMSSYAYQLVDEKDRWAIVNYVRDLQKRARN